MLASTKEDETHVMINPDATFKVIDTETIEHQKKKRKRNNTPSTGSFQISLLDEDDDSSSSVVVTNTNPLTVQTSFSNILSPPFLEAITPPISITSPFIPSTIQSNRNNSTPLVEIIDLLED